MGLTGSHNIIQVEVVVGKVVVVDSGRILDLVGETSTQVGNRSGAIGHPSILSSKLDPGSFGNDGGVNQTRFCFLTYAWTSGGGGAGGAGGDAEGDTGGEGGIGLFLQYCN